MKKIVCNHVGLNLASILLLTACSFMSPITAPTNSAYIIKATPEVMPVKTTNKPLTILLLQPSSASLYATRDMAYSSSPYKIDYYVKNRWAATPGEMLLPLMLTTLQKTNYFKAIVSAPYTGTYQYLLSSEITELLQDFTNQQPILRISLRVQLTSGITGKIINIKEFTRYQPMSAKEPFAGVIAANDATASILAELANWIINIHNHK